MQLMTNHREFPVSNIILPIFNLNQSKNDSEPTNSFSTPWTEDNWPETLIAQHSDLNIEINSIDELLSAEGGSLIQLDVRLKRLTKAVLTHLELEAIFLTPSLTANKLPLKQQHYLNQGFADLQTICHATIHYMHSLKLTFGNGLVTIKQRHRIRHFIAKINKRLNDENIIYSQLIQIKGVVSGV